MSYNINKTYFSIFDEFGNSLCGQDSAGLFTTEKSANTYLTRQRNDCKRTLKRVEDQKKNAANHLLQDRYEELLETIRVNIKYWESLKVVEVKISIVNKE